MKSYINFHTLGGGRGGGWGRGNTFLPPKGITIGRKYGVFCAVVVRLLILPSVLFHRLMSNFTI